MYYTPLLLAVVIGNPETVAEMLKNRTVDINAKCSLTGVNAFWLACFYGRPKCIALLANAGIDILVTHNETNSNGLHVAVERGHVNVVKQLCSSRFPLDLSKAGGITALMVCCQMNHVRDRANKVEKERKIMEGLIEDDKEESDHEGLTKEQIRNLEN